MQHDIASFQRYQLEFCTYLREPSKQPRPAATAARGLAVYAEIVFNNIVQSISACFPVAQKVVGKRAWQALARQFLAQHSASSPLFREIPAEFLQFLSTQTQLAPYLYSLCHYEWVELNVASMPKAAMAAQHNGIDADADLLAAPIAFTAAMQLLHYDYAVHKISARKGPVNTVSTELLVYRDGSDTVNFVELNALTYRLIALLQPAKMSGEQALRQLAHELKYEDTPNLIQFGREILVDFRHKGIIVGSFITPP
jgi:hypothetical protein